MVSVALLPGLVDAAFLSEANSARVWSPAYCMARRRNNRNNYISALLNATLSCRPMTWSRDLEAHPEGWTSANARHSDKTCGTDLFRSPHRRHIVVADQPCSTRRACASLLHEKIALRHPCEYSADNYWP
ncbi:hypothetical protein PoB_006731400 [Plakobranchus ocellatus]|uniref:Secreted protein n=1 Tax=Plakobranchus ocellatus TaxID=259542 RepID=A0AAV4D9A3_9GAST|nr:hypothetical protein PoB_006731400 [Plakobranchus ocellatus]